MPKNHKEDIVGVDIGAYSVKVLSVSREQNDRTVTAYNIKNLPLDGKDHKMENVIGEAFDEIDIKPKTVNISMSGPDVIVRFINLPKMTKEQLENALAFEAEKYIPFNVNEVVLDFVIMGKAPEPGQMKVLLAAGKKEAVDPLIRIFDRMGINVGLIDINALAVFNAYLSTGGLSEDEGTVFLDLGHSQTDILISTGDQPCFTRQVQIGGGDMTLAISRDLSVPLAKAEEIKMGLDQSNKEGAQRIMLQILDDLVKEIQLSFGYFENRYNKGISRVFCSGGLVYREGLLEYLGSRLGVPVETWDPVKGLKLAETLSKQDMGMIASRLAVCVGLALRNV
ncbi:MAG: type IV pilus assembly protein PilM [Candidatus Omnitrophica bacterium]|nr:type IV pilus assembly protein PilM [Candidatus Omnitrophota bacterium]MDD5488380.1 type IV pilus assembly protein PilM [Candidatus Omnitrophota bacterium]